MTHKERIQELRNILRTKEIDCGEEEEALRETIVIMERVEKLNRMPSWWQPYLHQVTDFICTGEEW